LNSGSYLRRGYDIAPPHRRCLHETGGCPAYFGGVFQPAVPDAAFRGEQVGLGAGDEFGSGGVVAAGAGVGLDDHGAGPVGQGDVCGAAAVLGDVDPGGVVVDGFEGLATCAVAAQPGGQQMVEPGGGDRGDVVC
jgi:hypothetical protein